MPINSYSDFKIFSKYLERLEDHFSKNEISILQPKNLALFCQVQDIHAYLEYIQILQSLSKPFSFVKQRAEVSMWQRKIFEHIVKLFLFYKKGFNDKDFKDYFFFLGVDNLIKLERFDELRKDVNFQELIKLPCPWYCRDQEWSLLITGKTISSLVRSPENLLKEVKKIDKFKEDELLGNKYHHLYGNWSDDTHSSLFNVIKHPHLGNTTQHIQNEIIVVGSELIGTLVCLIFLISNFSLDDFLSQFANDNLHLK